MIAKKLTPEIVREYHGDLLTRVKARLLTIDDVNHVLRLFEKADLGKVGGIAGKIVEMLAMFEIIDVDEFLKSTAVTLPIGFAEETFIYVPWKPGETDKFSLATQVEILSHEGTHADRANKNKGWLMNYLRSFARRTREERIAFQTSFEMCYLLHGTIPPLERLRGNLDKYFLRPTDEDVIIAGLSAIIEPIQQGDRSTPIGKWAAKWFEKRFQNGDQN